MEWYNKFKVGQQVKVVKKVNHWVFTYGGGCSWSREMDKTIGNVYTIIEIDKRVGYLLGTQILDSYYPDEEKYDFYYPVMSLASVSGQLLFDFYIK